MHRLGEQQIDEVKAGSARSSFGLSNSKFFVEVDETELKKQVHETKQS